MKRKGKDAALNKIHARPRGVSSFKAPKGEKGKSGKTIFLPRRTRRKAKKGDGRQETGDRKKQKTEQRKTLKKDFKIKQRIVVVLSLLFALFAVKFFVFLELL
ncbi:hypothetical protein JWG39_08335 [Desulforhopalus vacuolatus]|uniref:hypothetical protein n=1 Tax=Desulforhopalus vacuolatus TaxID=40414 RepID=UPI00196233F2|nr:hypothetical protein [Desulforhopalus vacuolatus]MBM9519824.1 hypothetical protein [Desulforhopalus vacuolatus]